MYDPSFENIPFDHPTRVGHSAMGISSFALAIVVTLGIFALFVVAGVIENNSPGGMDEQSSEAMLIGFGIIGAVFAEIIAFGLGIGGIVQQSKKRVFAIIGMSISGLIAMLTVGLIIIGLTMG